jgi:hypothetical protein
MSRNSARHAAESTALVITLTLLLSAAAVEVQAATILYTDRAAFNAAAGPTTLLTFAPAFCAPLAGLPEIFCRADYGLLTVTYDSVVRAGSLAPPHIFYGGIYQVGTHLTQPVTAVGFDITPLEPQIQFSLFLSLSGPPVGNFTFSAPSFLGFVSTDQAFSGFAIDNYYCTDFVGGRDPCAFTIDNMALHVPEPGVFSLFVPGLFLVWSAVRARKRIIAASVRIRSAPLS